MATEQQEEVVVDNTAEQDDSDADFAAGFAGTGDDKGTATPPESLPDAGAPVVDAASASTTSTEQQTPAATPAPSPEPKMVSVSEDELNQLRQQAQQGTGSVEQFADFSKKFDKIFGQVGALKQVVDKLRTETPAGETPQVTEEDFKELAAEYPELAKMQLTALNNVLKRFKGSSAVDPDVVEKTVAGRMAQVAEEMRETALNAVLPDWRTEVNKPEFQEWMTAQKPEIQALAASDKVSDAQRMLRLYDRHQSAPKTPAPPAPKPPAPPAPTVSPKQRQIAAAVTPRGDGAPTGAAAEEDEFEAGFKTG